MTDLPKRPTFQPPAPTTPSVPDWMKAYADRWKPPVNVAPTSFAPTSMNVARPAQAQTPFMPNQAPTSLNLTTPPSWLPSGKKKAGAPIQNQDFNPYPGSSSFLGGGGTQVNLGNGQTATTFTPVSSFQGGGGDWVMGPNRKAYYMGTPGPTTFIGAGGEAVRGPDYPIYPEDVPQPTQGGGYGGYSGFGTRYRRTNGDPYMSGGDRYPSWLMGLTSWNYKG